MRVEKRIMVLSLIPEPTRRNIHHLKDYPILQVLFFDFRMLAVSWFIRYASAQRAELRDSCTVLSRNFKSARTPLRTSNARVPWCQRISTRTNYNTRRALNRKPKNELRCARMSSSTNYYAGGTNTQTQTQTQTHLFKQDYRKSITTYLSCAPVRRE